MAVGAHALCELADVRKALEIPASDTDRDALLEALIDGASRAIMSETRREFAPATDDATRTFALRSGRAHISLAPYDLRTVQALTLEPGTPGEAVGDEGDDYLLEPVEARDGVHTRIRFAPSFVPAAASARMRAFGVVRVQVAGAWGWAAVPDDVRRAAVLTVASWAQTDVAAFALEGLEDARGIAPPPPRQYSIPPAAWRLLSPYAHRTAF